MALIIRHNTSGEDYRAVTYFDVKPPPGSLPSSSDKYDFYIKIYSPVFNFALIWSTFKMRIIQFFIITTKITEL
jgi:hypothetical protein